MRSFALLLAIVCVLAAVAWYFYFRDKGHPESVQSFKKVYEATLSRQWGNARELTKKGSPAWRHLRSFEERCRRESQKCLDPSDFSWRLESVKKKGGEAIIKMEVSCTLHARGGTAATHGDRPKKWKKVWGVMVKDDGVWKLKRWGGGDEAWSQADAYLSGSSDSGSGDGDSDEDD